MILEPSGTICAGTDFKGFGTDLNDLGTFWNDLCWNGF
jgi:hypothetical protein